VGAASISTGGPGKNSAERAVSVSALLGDEPAPQRQSSTDAAAKTPYPFARLEGVTSLPLDYE